MCLQSSVAAQRRPTHLPRWIRKDIPLNKGVTNTEAPLLWGIDRRGRVQ